MSSKKQVVVKSMVLKTQLDKPCDIVYIRSVDSKAVQKFEDYAKKLNMSRSQLFETLVLDGLK